MVKQQFKRIKFRKYMNRYAPDVSNFEQQRLTKRGKKLMKRLHDKGINVDEFYKVFREWYADQFGVHREQKINIVPSESTVQTVTIDKRTRTVKHNNSDEDQSDSESEFDEPENKITSHKKHIQYIIGGTLVASIAAFIFIKIINKDKHNYVQGIEPSTKQPEQPEQPITEQPKLQEQEPTNQTCAAPSQEQHVRHIKEPISIPGPTPIPGPRRYHNETGTICYEIRN